LIAIDQDPLGKQADVLLRDEGTGTMVLARPLASGGRAIALYNASDQQQVLRVPAAGILGSAPAYRLHHVWSGAATQAATIIAAGVPAHGAAVMRATPLEDAAALPPSLSVGGSLGTLIAGSAEGATLSAVTENHGVGDASELALSIEAPAGWTV